MNTTVKSLALALGMGLATTTVKAQDAATVIDTPNYIAKMITAPNSTQLKVLVGNLEGQKLFLTLKDAKGNALYSRTIGKNEPQAYIKLNMDELPDGIYNIVMGDKKSASTKSFKKGTEVMVSRPVETLVAVN
jgi:hypothetical protein